MNSPLGASQCCEAYVPWLHMLSGCTIPISVSHEQNQVVPNRSCLPPHLVDVLTDLKLASFRSVTHAIHLGSHPVPELLISLGRCLLHRDGVPGTKEFQWFPWIYL